MMMGEVIRDSQSDDSASVCGLCNVGDRVINEGG